MSEFFRRRLKQSRACQRCQATTPVEELERQPSDIDVSQRVDAVDPGPGPSSAHFSRQTTETRRVTYCSPSRIVDGRVTPRRTHPNRVHEDECTATRNSRSPRRHRRRQRRSRSLTIDRRTYSRSRSSSFGDTRRSRQNRHRASSSSNESSPQLHTYRRCQPRRRSSSASTIVINYDNLHQEPDEGPHGCDLCYQASCEYDLSYAGPYEYGYYWDQGEYDRGYHSC